jgi:formate dehydrogenase major subunit
MPDSSGEQVLRALDKLLADRPEKSGHDFSEATRRLTAWRAHLIARWRQTHAETDRRNLERVNAAISIVVGGQFPLGPVPWKLIEEAQKDLADLASA